MDENKVYPAKRDVIDGCRRHDLFVVDSGVFTHQLTGDGVAESFDIDSEVSCPAVHFDDDVPVDVLLKVCSERQRQKLTVTIQQTASDLKYVSK